MTKDYIAISAIRKRYADARKNETLKRNRLLKELEDKRRADIKELQKNHQNQVDMIHEAYSQQMQEYAETEADEIEGAQR